MAKELEAFDYGTLSSNEAQAVKADAEWVRSTYRALQATTLETVAEIGGRLLTVRETIGHGNFLPWLAAEFVFSRMTAQRMMNVAENFTGEQMSHVLHLPHRTVYAICAPSTPEAVRSFVKDRSPTDERLEAAEIEHRITEAKEEARKADAIAKRKPRDVLRARRDAKIEEKRKADLEAQFEQEKREAREAFDMIEPLLGDQLSRFAALIAGSNAYRFSQLIQAAARELAA